MSNQVISVTFQNNSGQTLYIGLNQADGPWLQLSGTGAPQWVPAFDQTTCVAEVANGSPFNFDFPQYSGAGCRMYVSEQKLTGAPNLATADFIYDKIEMGWDAVWNLTSVDFIGIPMQMTFNGQTIGFLDGVTRDGLYGKLAKMPSPYNTFTYPATAPFVRYFAPSKVSAAQQGTILDKAIEIGLTAINGYAGPFDYGGFYFSNLAYDSNAGTLSCTAKDASGSNNVNVVLSDISTYNAFGNTIKFTPTGDNWGGQAAAKFAGLIGAAINRGVLDTPDSWGCSGATNKAKAWLYYQNTKGNADEYNYYSQVLHQYSIDGLCYGMSYDDFFTQDTAFTVNGGDSIKITALPFTGGSMPNPYIPPKTSCSGGGGGNGKYTLTFGVPSGYPFPDLGYIKIGQEVFNNVGALHYSTNNATVEVGFTKISDTITLDLENGTITKNANCITGLNFVAKGLTLYFPPNASWGC